MMTVDHRAGRLLEVRIASPVVMEDFPPFTLKLSAAMVPHDKVIFCADWRRADLFSSEVSDKFLAIMKNDNPKIERSAFLLGDAGAVFAMQLERLIWQAGSPDRKTFRDPKALKEWLQPSLNAIELLRLDQFIGRH